MIRARAGIPPNPSTKPTRGRSAPTRRSRSSSRPSWTTCPRPPRTCPRRRRCSGDIAGAPGKLPYAADVYRYMRMLEAASPRVKVRTIGKTEEGREMIAVAVASERLIAAMDENRAAPGASWPTRARSPWTTRKRTSWWRRRFPSTTSPAPSTPRRRARPPRSWSWPTAWPWTRARTSAYIRDHVVTLITPVVEVDGRDRQVDVYNWHLAHPERELAAARLLGPLRRPRQQPRRHGPHLEPHAQRARRRTSSRRPRSCTTCTSRCRSSTTTPSATAPTTPGSIPSSPTSGR